MKKCDIGMAAAHGGTCCCNCKHQVIINKHPWNKGDGKGPVSNRMGYGCSGTGGNRDREKYGDIIFFDMDLEHGLCEMWRDRNESNHHREP
jgi:hypothetical protein